MECFQTPPQNNVSSCLGTTPVNPPRPAPGLEVSFYTQSCHPSLLGKFQLGSSSATAAALTFLSNHLDNLQNWVEGGYLNQSASQVTTASGTDFSLNGSGMGTTSLVNNSANHATIASGTGSSPNSSGAGTTSLVDNPFISQLLAAIRLGTPGNDNIVGEESLDIQIGRVGNDRLLGVNPANPVPGQGETDILIGGPLDLEGATAGPNNNLFILGDYNKPYYASGTTNLGTNDFALIVDFQFQGNDFIRLNGRPSDYFLATFDVTGLGQLGTAIFRGTPDAADLIALVPGLTPLDLNAPYFEYVNTPPPNTDIQPGVTQFGSTGVDFGFDVSADSKGNAYVGGLTTGDLGGANLGSQDGFLTKVDSSGNVDWTAKLESAGVDRVFGTAVSGDAVYAAGFSTGDLGGPNQGGNDAFLTKYDTNGNQQWIQKIATGGLDTALSVNADAAGNTFVAGFTTGNLDTVDGSVLTGSGDDPYVAKFNSNGALQWIQQFGSDNYDESYGVTTDPFGNVYLTGFTLGNLAGTNAGNYDTWIAKVNGTTGQLEWTRQFGTPDYEFSWDVATDSQGNVYATGWTLGNLGGTNAGEYDAWVTKFDPSGNQQWTTQFGTAESEHAFGIAIDANDRIYVTGYTAGTLGKQNFGGDVLGREDAFITYLDSDGHVLGTEQFGTSGVDRSFGIDASNPGEVVVAGLTDGSFGDPNLGSFDVWVRSFPTASLTAA